MKFQLEIGLCPFGHASKRLLTIKMQQSVWSRRFSIQFLDIQKLQLVNPLISAEADCIKPSALSCVRISSKSFYYNYFLMLPAIDYSRLLTLTCTTHLFGVIHWMF